MLLLISDANVLIDMEAGEITQECFSLPYRFGIPDLLYEEEIKPDSPSFEAIGLEPMTVSSVSVEYAMGLGDRPGAQPGMNDRLALALSKEKKCPLLTGDRQLRTLAAQEGVEVKGTLWILEELIRSGRLSPERAQARLNLMRLRGRRLPWEHAAVIVRRFKKPRHGKA